ncbi:MAG: N-acetylhexosamine 1-kinase [Firmicutes bacterium ADurb.BinA205]|nr:MAG: N-acetylhexosamine 1-kinase [Firmicutes bacterium ADurb.BinA205]
MDIHDISALFGISAKEAVRLEKGHINHTFLVTSQTGERYVLQSLNCEVFHSPEAVMLNTSQIESALADEKSVSVPCFLRHDGKNCAEWGGNTWRMYPYAESGKCEDISYTIGFSYGRFMRRINAVPLKLSPVIEDFHNYSVYVEKLKAAAPSDNIPEELEKLGHELAEIFADVPKRNIHGDAKADNIIIGKPCTVIDLDTAMHGYAALDYGDMVRSVDTGDTEALTKGFADGLDGMLTDREVQSLYYGVLWCTGELAVRYLTDVYAEKRYFSGKSREQCRGRAESLMIQLRDFMGMKSDFETIIKNTF